jgi:predicted amidohydrolase YtcJ
MHKPIVLVFLLAISTAVCAQQYDVVLEGGHVMDPETGLDGVRNVGIANGRIARISSESLSGRRVIHATGLIVAPGFIDLHQHGQDLASERVKALDGVTTALEMEIGAPDVARFLKEKEGRSLIHYGTAASHVAARPSCPRADLRPTNPQRPNRLSRSAGDFGANWTPAVWPSAWVSSTRRAPRALK